MTYEEWLEEYRAYSEPEGGWTSSDADYIRAEIWSDIREHLRGDIMTLYEIERLFDYQKLFNKDFNKFVNDFWSTFSQSGGVTFGKHSTRFSTSDAIDKAMSIEKVILEEESKEVNRIAVEFDGMLVENEYPGIGAPKDDVVSFVKQLKASGWKIILWTRRLDDALTAAVYYCEKYLDITFDQISHKTYANIYLDPRALNTVPPDVITEILCQPR